MLRILKRRLEKVGLPPGSLVRADEKPSEPTRMTVIAYNQQKIRQQELESVEQCFDLREPGTITWIDVEGLEDVHVLERLGECYGLHHLVLEDILNADQRPKLEDHGDYLYIVVRTLAYEDEDHDISSQQISLILGNGFVLSLQEAGSDLFEPIRERLHNSLGRIREMSADYLTYALLDVVVDNYFVLMERLGERMEEVEEEVVSAPKEETLHNIHSLRQELSFLRNSFWPLREAVNSLQRGESPLIQRETLHYLRDLYDHVIRVIETAGTYREITAAMLDTYLSSISNRMNEVMKVLTIIATLFIPLTFIAGVYGMNFHYMPELSWQWAYPAVLLAMVMLTGIMLSYFRRRKWL